MDTRSAVSALCLVPQWETNGKALRGPDTATGGRGGPLVRAMKCTLQLSRVTARRHTSCGFLRTCQVRTNLFSLKNRRANVTQASHILTFLEKVTGHSRPSSAVTESSRSGYMKVMRLTARGAGMVTPEPAHSTGEIQQLT